MTSLLKWAGYSSHIHGMEWGCHLHLFRHSRNGNSTLSVEWDGHSTSTFLSEIDIPSDYHMAHDYVRESLTLNWFYTFQVQTHEGFHNVRMTGWDDPWLVHGRKIIRCSQLLNNWIMEVDVQNHEGSQHMRMNGWVDSWLWYGWKYDGRRQLVVEHVFQQFHNKSSNS